MGLFDKIKAYSKQIVDEFNEVVAETKEAKETAKAENQELEHEWNEQIASTRQNFFKPTLPSTSVVKKETINQLVKLDYPKIYKRVKIVGKIDPSIGLFLPTIMIMEKAANKYNESKSPDKDEKYFKYLAESIDAESMLELLRESEELRDAIPASRVLMLVLGQIAKSKK